MAPVNFAAGLIMDYLAEKRTATDFIYEMWTFHSQFVHLFASELRDDSLVLAERIRRRFIFRNAKFVI